MPISTISIPTGPPVWRPWCCWRTGPWRRWWPSSPSPCPCRTGPRPARHTSMLWPPIPGPGRRASAGSSSTMWTFTSRRKSWTASPSFPPRPASTAFSPPPASPSASPPGKWSCCSIWPGRAARGAPSPPPVRRCTTGCGSGCWRGPSGSPTPTAPSDTRRGCPGWPTAGFTC